MIIWLITGLWIALSCAQLAHIITLFTDGSLQTYTQLGCVLVLVGIFAYIGFLCLAKRKQWITFSENSGMNFATAKSYVKDNLFSIVVFAILAFISIAHLCVNYVPELTDGTYDIVLGNLQSGNIHEVHPFIGDITESAMPLRRQVIGLASFYSALITVFDASVYTVLCKIVPICLWSLSMLLYWEFGTHLFEKEKDRWLFVTVVALFYLVSNGGVGLVGAQLFRSGFTGEAIRSALLMPYVLYVSWQKKWLLAMIALIAEVSIVWTTFGIGYCFLIVVCMFLVHLFLKWRAKHAARVE